MKTQKEKFRLLLFILALITLITLLIFGCSKPERYITPIDTNVVFDKSITASFPRVTNQDVEFKVDFPPRFNHRKRWYFDYGNSSNAVIGSGIINYKYKKSGVYMVRCEGWNSDNTEMILSNGLKIKITQP